MSDPTVSAPAPASAVVPTPAPVVEKTLQQFRAERAAPPEPDPTPAPEPVAPLSADAEPPEPPDEGEGDPPAASEAEATKELKHKWKTQTGRTLDLRRRDHRQIKRDYEDFARVTAENADLRARLTQPAPSQTAPQPQAQPVALQPDPNDPEPTLEQFAEQPDPYGAFVAAQARWHARQEFQQQSSQRATVERTQRTRAAIASRQEAFDAALPTIRERYADFDAAHDEVIQTLARVPAPVRAPIIHRLLTGQHGHDLAYFLGNHPQELQRLVTARTPSEQQFVMGEIAATVKASLTTPPPAVPINPPAAPMIPVNGGGTPTSYNAQTADLAAFRAKHGVRGGRRVAS